MGHFAGVCKSGKKDKSAAIEGKKDDSNADTENSAIETQFAYIFAIEAAERK